MPGEYSVKRPAIRPTLGSFALNYLNPPAIIRLARSARTSAMGSKAERLGSSI